MERFSGFGAVLVLAGGYLIYAAYKNLPIVDNLVSVLRNGRPVKLLDDQGNPVAGGIQIPASTDGSGGGTESPRTILTRYSQVEGTMFP